MSIVAEWVGGPHDGQQVKLNVDHVKIVFTGPMPMTPDLDIEAAPPIRAVRVPVVLTRDGYRLYWPKDMVP